MTVDREIKAKIESCNSGSELNEYFTNLLKGMRSTLEKKKEKRRRKTTRVDFLMGSVLISLLEQYNSNHEAKNDRTKSEAGVWIEELVRHRNKFIAHFCTSERRKRELENKIDLVRGLSEAFENESKNSVKYENVKDLIVENPIVENPIVENLIVEDLTNLYNELFSMRECVLQELFTLEGGLKRKIAPFVDARNEAKRKVTSRIRKLNDDVTVLECRMTLMERLFPSTLQQCVEKLTVSAHTTVHKIMNSYFKIRRCLEERYLLSKESKSLIETFEKRRRTIENIQSSIREEQIQGENTIEKRRQLEGELSLLEDRRKFYDILIREGTELFAMFEKHFKENGKDKDIVHEVSQSAFEDIKFEISKRRRLRVASSNNFSREKHSLSERSSPVSRKRLRRMQDDTTSLSSMQSFGNDFDVEEKTDDGDGANTFFSIQRFEHELDMEVDSDMEVKCGDDDDDDDDNDDDDNGKNGNEIRSVESVLPRINQSQCKEVEEMRKNEEVDVIVTKYKVAMKRKKWMCLRGSEWLNDEVINFYMEILKEKS